jgi:DNA sulfur modification protein DndD
MILQSIKLVNFRQYFGEQKITFSQSSSKNVTIIHGENGSGKTALLNAFNWCLYGENDLPHPRKIINDHAINKAENGERIEAKVQIEFKQDNVDYIIIRSVQLEKGEAGNTYLEPSVTMQIIDQSGLCKEEDNVQNRIDQLLPNDLRTYFFFDGERIDNLSKQEGSKDIKSAIKLMMGLEILERSIQHTEAARKKFRSDLKKNGNVETNKIISEIETLENEKEGLKERALIYEDNLTALHNEKIDIESRLKTIQESKVLQQEREDKEEEKRNKEEALKDIREKLKYFVSKYGYLGFTSHIVKETLDLIKSESEKNSNIFVKESIINALIERGTCICGQDLFSGSIHMQHLIELKEQVQNEDIHGSALDMAGSLKIVDEKRKGIYFEMKRLKESEVEAQDTIIKLTEQLDEISTKLTGKNSEKVASLENKRKDIEDQTAEFNRKIGQIDYELKKVEKELQEKEKEQSKIESLQEEDRLIKERIDACLTVENIFKQIYEVQEIMVKDRLQERISKVYSEFLRKGYNVAVSKDYELKVINSQDEEVSMSQGERQITSLSFIGAIVDIAREQYKSKEKQAFNEGGIYPLVMDSPFGSLDSDHRRRVAQGIPKLADQVIVIVSTSQWRGEVEEQLSNSIGKEYKLQYNDPRHNADEPYEYTNVMEVK